MGATRTERNASAAEHLSDGSRTRHADLAHQFDASGTPRRRQGQRREFVSHDRPQDAGHGRFRFGAPALDPKAPHHPEVLRHAKDRAQDRQLRLADRITAVAGSMQFVYVHIAFFALWMLVFEDSPWPTLTLTVSLEAIFLSTFVLISQNRQAAFQQAKADHDYRHVNQLLEENTRLTRNIHELTEAVHDRMADPRTDS
jgi:hypothetical protein